MVILLVDGTVTQNEQLILSQAQNLKNNGIQILPIVVGFANPLWDQVTSYNGYILLPAGAYSSLPGQDIISRIQNYICGK